MKKVSLCIIVVIAALSLVACQDKKTVQDNSKAVNVLKTVKTSQSFAEGKVSEEDLKSILEAGINAESGFNTQPWHFSVVSDNSVLKEIESDMGNDTPSSSSENDGDKTQQQKKKNINVSDAAVAIIISKETDLDSAMYDTSFDSGLACQNMLATAQLLNYGTKIVASPTIALNGSKQSEYKTKLGIPSNMQAVAVLLLGKTDDSTDATSSASTRNDFNDVVTYVK